MSALHSPGSRPPSPARRRRSRRVVSRRGACRQGSGGALPKGRVPTGRVPTGRVPEGRVPKGRVPTGPVPKGRVPKGLVPKGRSKGALRRGSSPPGPVQSAFTLRRLRLSRFGCRAASRLIDRRSRTLARPGPARAQVRRCVHGAIERECLRTAAHGPRACGPPCRRASAARRYTSASSGAIRSPEMRGGALEVIRPEEQSTASSQRVSDLHGPAVSSELPPRPRAPARWRGQRPTPRPDRRRGSPASAREAPRPASRPSSSDPTTTSARAPKARAG